MEKILRSPFRPPISEDRLLALASFFEDEFSIDLIQALSQARESCRKVLRPIAEMLYTLFISHDNAPSSLI